ncbi:unnamed protein product [Adineta steineri]|uniref:SURF1-like protein n=1 Tax=Adineta steineri TaxID=433720 RepID=A0A819JAI3_9BILA|nr:unnamed protein product [Adineta steineri]CAF3930652.1 unnamed protein product [Adineta steineri]
MISRQILFVRPYLSNQISVVFRHVHISKPIYQSNNRPFTLSKRNKKDKIDSGALFLLIIPVSTFLLGCWQVNRRKWKINLIQTLKSRIDAEPISLLENLDRLPELEYYPVRVRGKFDHSREIFVEPRSRLDLLTHDNRASSRQASTSQTTHGAHVITPFRVANRNYDILVNRGYVPFDLRDPSTRISGQIEDEHEIIGLLRSTDYLNTMWNKNEPSRNIWRTRDVAEMAAAMKTAPIFIDEVKSTSVPGGPIGGQTNIQLRNEHLSYIATWFSLSAFTTVMWLRKYLL